MNYVARGFLFVRGHTIIHRFDPRVRLFFSFSLFLMSLLTDSIIVLISLILITFSITLVARIGKRFARAMVFSGIISIIAFALNYFLFPQPLHTAVILGLRLFAIIGSTSIFFLTTTPDELEQVMKWFRLPPDFIMVFVIAVRFVPVLLIDALQIMDAQRSRGLELEKGNLIKRIRNTVPVIVPLLAVAVSRSLDLAEAMDSRAYGSTNKPTSLYHMKLQNLDVIAISVTLGLLVLGFYTVLYLKPF